PRRDRGDRHAAVVSPFSVQEAPHPAGLFICENRRMNADPAELAKFDQLAHRWWDPQGEFRPLHAINPLRLDWIDAHLGLSGKNVLDVGCGGGILSEAMAQRGARVTGIRSEERRGGKE